MEPKSLPGKYIANPKVRAIMDMRMLPLMEYAPTVHLTTEELPYVLSVHPDVVTKAVTSGALRTRTVDGVTCVNIRSVVLWLRSEPTLKVTRQSPANLACYHSILLPGLPAAVVAKAAGVPVGKVPYTVWCDCSDPEVKAV